MGSGFGGLACVQKWREAMRLRALALLRVSQSCCWERALPGLDATEPAQASQTPRQSPTGLAGGALGHSLLGGNAQLLFGGLQRGKASGNAMQQWMVGGMWHA